MKTIISQCRVLHGHPFEQPGLESQYRLEYRLAAVRVGYLFSFMASFSFCVFSLVEFVMLHRGVDHFIQQQRFLFIVVFFVIGVHAKLRSAIYERFYEYVASILIVLYAAAILYFELNTQMAGHPEFFYLSVNSTCILLTIACYYYMRLPLLIATILALTLGGITFYAVHTSGVFNATVAGRMLTYIGVSNAVGLWIRGIFDRRDREIFAQNHKINALMLAKTKLLATMSHEMRTPMNTVARLLSAVQRDFGNELSDQRMAMFRQVEQACDQLVATLDDLLHFAAIGGQAPVRNETPFSLAAMVKECADLVTPSAKEKGLSLIVTLPEHHDAELLGHPQYLRRVLVNLLENAIKFTSHGNVSVTAKLEPEGGLTKATVAVSDTGIGIAPEEHQNIFQLFYQVESSYARRFNGTGLGLAICRQLMTAMGGDIHVTSAMGHGSTFSARFVAKMAPTGIDEKLNSAIG